MNQTSGSKSYQISKHTVFEAYLRVKANKGAAGVDGVSIEQFEVDLRGNLYKLWNRMSSGCYFPPPVRMVEIPKPGGSGKVRVLGVPTVADRIAQTVVAMVLEPMVEPGFHPDSYGYRPLRSALDAVEVCRERCWSTDWVIDLDIQGFFDNLDHDLVLKAVAHHTDQRWIWLYVERWLKAPLQKPDGILLARGQGSGESAGLGDLAVVVQPVHALRVRSLDGPGAPGGPVRAVLRRRGGPLPQRDRSAPGARGHRWAAGRVRRVAAASRQDPPRVLPGREEAWLGRVHLVHVPGVRVSRTEGPDEAGDVLLQLQPSHQRRGRQTHPGADPPLAAAPAQWSDSGAARPGDQPGRAGPEDFKSSETVGAMRFAVRVPRV